MTELLRVIPNPFCHLDHEGQPAGTFPYDPTHARGARRWVGARIDRSPAADGKPKTRATGRESREDFAMRAKLGGQSRTVKITASPQQRTVFAFDLSPQTLPVSEHFLLGLREGSLIPADEATAKRGRVPFVDPAEALQKAADKAIKDWEQAWGEPPDVDSWEDYLRIAAGLAEPPAPPGEENAAKAATDAAPALPPSDATAAALPAPATPETTSASPAPAQQPTSGGDA